MNESWLLELIARNCTPLAGVFPVQFDRGRDVEVGNGTLGVDEHDDERFLVLEAGERARPAVDILQAEVGDDRAHRGGRDLRVRRGGEPELQLP